MASSYWSWDPRHILVSRDAVRAMRASCQGRDYHILSRLLAKLEARVKDPYGHGTLTKAQTEVLADCLTGYQSSWAVEAAAIIDQAIRLAHDGTPKPERVRAAEELLDTINGKVLA